MASVLPGLRCSELVTGKGCWDRDAEWSLGGGRHSGKTEEGGLTFLSTPAQPPHPQTPAPKVSFLEYICGQGAYYPHTPIAMHCCPELNSTSPETHCLVLVLSHERNHSQISSPVSASQSLALSDFSQFIQKPWEGLTPVWNRTWQASRRARSLTFPCSAPAPWSPPGGSARPGSVSVVTQLQDWAPSELASSSMGCLSVSRGSGAFEASHTQPLQTPRCLTVC